MTLETAKQAIDALKGSPLLLGVMILQLIVLLGFAYALHEIADSAERRDGMLKACIEGRTT